MESAVNLCSPWVAPLLLTALATGQSVVFSTDFDTTMPAQIAPGTAAALEGVQGYAGLGPVGNVFGGKFLRSATGNKVTLSLSGLPAHTSISLDFLFAAIDSLDGSGAYPSGDYFKVTVDGLAVFRESFANALASQIQSYAAPAGITLARRVDLGFSGPGSYYTDSAYYLGADPVFVNLPHSGPTLTVTFEIEGPGIQGLDDESWGMDNLRVRVATNAPGHVAPYGSSCGPVIQAGGLPAIGRALPVSLSALPSSTTVATLGLGASSASLGALPLPMPLDFLGMPRCWLLQDLSLIPSYPMALSGASATTNLPIPNDPALRGVQVFTQGIVLAPGANPAGVVLSGGLRLLVGT